ncbi:MAG: DNA polymerase I [Phycisphaerae bacterium]|nr:DNA polymerase I [Phycisphaerae bacterium]
MPHKTLYLIDGHAQIYRAYYAPFGNLTSPRGEPTRAVHVFTQMLLNLLRDRKPDHLAMIMDVDDRTVFRVQIDPEYKANRDKSPEDLGPQIDRIVSIVSAMKIPILRLSGFEADDIIATLCHRFARDPLDVYLVSRDKDLDQLLTDRVRMYDPGKDVVIDAASMTTDKGYPPGLAVEAQMLIGDSADNVKGVPGVGPKKAAQLLSQYGSVAAIIENAEQLTPKLRENMLAFRDRMDAVRQLVTLRRDVPIDLTLESADVSRFTPAAAGPILAELGLNRLLDRIAGASPDSGSRDSAAPPAMGALDARRNVQMASKQDTLFSSSETTAPDEAAQDEYNHASSDDEATHAKLTAESTFADGLFGPDTGGDLISPLQGTDNPAYRLIDTEAALTDLATTLAKQSAFAFDTETTGLVPVDSDLCGISIAYEFGSAYYIAVRGVGPLVTEEAVRTHLGPIFADERIRKCGQNLKYDLNILAGIGIVVRGVDFDSMIASFVLDPLRRSHGIDGLAMELLHFRKIPTQALIGKGKDQITFAQVPTDRTSQYACEDADIAWRLRQSLEKQMTDPEIRALFHDLEMPLVEVLMRMERHGIAVDRNLLLQLSGEMTERLARLEVQIHEQAKRPFNINSTKQLAEVLFDELGLRVVKRTRTSRSTDAEVLETLANETEQPILRLLLEHRELSKLKGTYVDSLPDMISRRTGRIHPSFHQAGAVTGRLSCSDPNLQNIPIRTEEGAKIRRAFVPGNRDHVLIKADYSQIELRVLAHFSGDENLRDAFLHDRDIHAFVAAQLNDIPIEDVSKEQRSRAKTVNFGIVYGQSAFGLARQTGMSQADARQFIDRYFARYPRIRGFLDQCVEHARRHGYVKTILGRRRPIADISSRNQAARNAAERLAVNTVVQGSAADLIKRAMINLDRRIETERRPMRMLLQVHDELVFEVPRERAAEEARVIVKEMSEALTLNVPIRVDVAVGENWLDMTSVM